MDLPNKLALDLAVLAVEARLPATSMTEYLLRVWRLADIIQRLLNAAPIPGPAARAALRCLQDIKPVPGDINANLDAWTALAQGQGVSELRLADEADPGQ